MNETHPQTIMVITDRFTKMVRAISMGRVHAFNRASAFVDYEIAAYGPPDRILSDRGPYFTAWFWGQVCNLLSVEPNITTPSCPQTNGHTERFNRAMGRILDHYVAEHPKSWDQLLGALTPAYNSRPHRSTGVARLELVHPMGVESWAFKDLRTRSNYPLAAQTGMGAEKRAQAALLLRLTKMMPQVKEALKVTQNCYKRSHDGLLRPSAHEVTAGGFAFTRDQDYKGNKLGHRIRGPYRVLAVDGPTAVLEILGKHRRENVVHLIPCEEGPPADLNERPALRCMRRDRGPSEDGHRFAADRIAGHADQDDG